MEQMGRPNRLIRKFNCLQTREKNVKGDNEELWVVGKAVVFDTPTVLFTLGDTEYKEQIDSRAFENCNISDVIFNYNHSGKVMARTRNNTLKIEVRNDGLYMEARLDGTEEGRCLYEEIKGGYIDQMSFQFSIQEESYDKENHMWTVLKVKRLYDVSAVDIPAYEDTSIEARRNSILEAEAQEKRKRKAAADLRKRILRAKILLNNSRKEN